MRKPVATALLALTLACGVSACGSDADERRLQQEQIARAEAEARREARMEERIEQAGKETAQLRRELRLARRQATTSSSGTQGRSAHAAAASSDAGTCGGGITVNSVTTCPFARNVRNAYYASGQDGVVRVYSPVTTQTYVMNCTPGSPHACTGGNGARVTFP